MFQIKEICTLLKILPMEAICINCQSQSHKDFVYCPKCSQKMQLHRLTFHDILHEGIHYFTHADKGLFQLIRDLAVKRGRVAREFIEGKRKKYFPPMTFFFLVIAINLFVSTKTDDHTNFDIAKAYPHVTTISDPVEKARWVEIYTRRERGVHFINTNINTIAMVSLPIIAFVFWLFYRRSRYNYVEHLVAGMYMFGFYTLFIIVAASVGYLLGIPENVVYIVSMLFQIGYYTLFYGSFIPGKGIRAFFASFLSILLLFVISGMLMWIYMFMEQ